MVDDSSSSSSSSSSTSSTNSLWDFNNVMNDEETNMNGSFFTCNVKGKSWMKRNHKGGINEESEEEDCFTTAVDTTTLRTIFHLDVDCFYCQCESIMDPRLATKPFAVGQKHIIVTCNYRP